MGATDSKLVFKQSIFKLSDSAAIAADDPFWTAFWELPESTEDITTLFSPLDIRRTRDQSLENLETLILAVISRLFALRDHPSFPDADVAPERDALNCLRILTRVLPFLYEAENLEGWEDRFFWGARRRRVKTRDTTDTEVLFDESKPERGSQPDPAEDEFETVRPLAEELLDSLIDLLFYADFTIPQTVGGKSKVSYAIWQSGVGCHTPIATSKEFESNRCEVLRLLLTLASRSMYMPASTLSTKGVPALTYLASCTDKQIVLSVLCSLLNTMLILTQTMKYNPASWRVPYDHVVFKDAKETLINNSLQFLLILALYHPPEKLGAWPAKNYYRHYLSRLHRAEDFQFLVDAMGRVLKQPLQANSSYLPGSQKTIRWAPEMMMLFWELLQCNKNFRAFIIETDRVHDFLVLILFYALDHKDDQSRHGVLRMCVFTLQTLSTESKFAKRLNKKFEGQSSLPPSVRIEGFHGSYADYLIISLYNLITFSPGKLQANYPAMLAIISNVAPYLEALSATTSTKIMQLFATMSSPSFLLANEFNHHLLATLLEAINALVEYQFGANTTFVLAVLHSKKRFEALRHFTLESGQAEVQRQQQRKEERSDEAGNPNASRESSNEIPRIPSSGRRGPLPNVQEESDAFAIGDDDDSDGDMAHAVPLQRPLSGKARGKLPAGARTFSRQSSTVSLSHSSATAMPSEAGFAPTDQWIDTWLPELPLHTVLTLIQELSPLLSSNGSATGSNSSDDLQVISQADVRGIDPSPIKVHYFEWSPLALGWYESLLWGLIFASDIHFARGSAGVWSGTGIKLFRVQEVAAAGPSLLQPRGAVDAVGSSLINRIGSLNIRGGAGSRPREDPA
ncbi:MAG: hypothetical protein M1826_002418 [Phylliscum demangeonii]|nr:MAG: hypothetical protein M1826_002418 [Phylliscum demangeonii]